MRRSRSDALATLFDDHADAVFRVLRRFGVADVDLEDEAQEVFLIAHRKLHRFEDRASLRTWVLGICRRRAAAYRRRAHRRREIAVSRLPTQASDADPRRDLEVRRGLELLDSVLAVMPARQREVYVLYEIEELAMTDVARIIGCRRATAYARLAAARRSIQSLLRRRGRSVA